MLFLENVEQNIHSILKLLNKIQPLSQFTISQIAAGEVIEHPGSVVKELVENSIDADAKRIEVFIEGGGFTSIQVRDDGHGVHKDDLPLAITSFTTSKLTKIDDLFTISSYGFRGEALGAITSVANISLESKAMGFDVAYKITKQVGDDAELTPTSLPNGTRIIVSDLFHTLPVRKKFNKNQHKIKKEIIDVITNFAISYPSISYYLQYDTKVIIDIPSSNNLSNRIKQLFSQSFLDSLIPIYNEKEDKKFEGYISGFQFYKSNSEHIRFFINHRIITYPKLIKILKQVYGELMPPGRLPVAILCLEISSQNVDVNVHPQKKEVRFQEEGLINNFFYRTLQQGIESHNSLSFKHLAKKVTNKKIKATSISSNHEYEQINFNVPLQISDNTNKKKEYYVEQESNKNHLKTASQNTTTHNAIFFSELKLHEKLYDTFIVATSQEGIYLFDQHTIHERVNYENFLAKLKKKQTTKQELLTPLPLNLSRSEQEVVEQYQDILNEIGFEHREIGPSELGLSSVPFYVANFKEEEAFHLCIKQILDTKDPEKKGLNAEQLFDELAASLACRAAIKKGDPASISLIKELIEKLKQCDAPMRCPHGRPTMVFLGKQDISTLFKRT